MKRDHHHNLQRAYVGQRQQPAIERLYRAWYGSNEKTRFRFLAAIQPEVTFKTNEERS
jgi:hypothetical protein